MFVFRKIWRTFFLAISIWDSPFGLLVTNSSIKNMKSGHRYRKMPCSLVTHHGSVLYLSISLKNLKFRDGETSFFWWLDLKDYCTRFFNLSFICQFFLIYFSKFEPGNLESWEISRWFLLCWIFFPILLHSVRTLPLIYRILLFLYTSSIFTSLLTLNVPILDKVKNLS